MQPNEIARVNKGAYGLIDASCLWYCALVKELMRLGMEACPFDLCVFVLREDAVVPDGDEQISRTKPSQGNIVGVHVDEGICGGGSKFQEVPEET